MADRGALIAVYLARRADLVRFFTKRTRSPEAAEDIVQEIYVRISAGPLPEVVRHPGAFLYRVGSNLMIDRAKGDARRAVREEDWARAGGVGEPGETAGAFEALAARQRMASIQRELDRLPPRVARAFRRHKFDGLSHAEVAAELGVSRSAVEKYIMTALHRLLEVTQ